MKHTIISADEQWGQVVLHPHMEWGHQEELVAELEALPSVAWALPVAEEGGLLYVDKGDVRGVFLRGTDINRQVRLENFANGLLRQKEGDASFDLDSSAKRIRSRRPGQTSGPGRLTMRNCPQA